MLIPLTADDAVLTVGPPEGSDVFFAWTNLWTIIKQLDPILLQLPVLIGNDMYLQSSDSFTEWYDVHELHDLYKHVRVENSFWSEAFAALEKVVENKLFLNGEGYLFSPGETESAFHIFISALETLTVLQEDTVKIVGLKKGDSRNWTTCDRFEEYYRKELEKDTENTYYYIRDFTDHDECTIWWG